MVGTKVLKAQISTQQHIFKKTKTYKIITENKITVCRNTSIQNKSLLRFGKFTLMGFFLLVHTINYPVEFHCHVKELISRSRSFPHSLRFCWFFPQDFTSFLISDLQSSVRLWLGHQTFSTSRTLLVPAQDSLRPLDQNRKPSCQLI